MTDPFDLSDYNFGELKGLLFEVEQAIRERARQEREQVHGKARERILAIARDVGVAPEQLLADAATAPRYRNPLDASQTWSGRGRQPRWVVEALAGGKRLDELT